jgi:GTP cyclohydrolase I
VSRELRIEALLKWIEKVDINDDLRPGLAETPRRVVKAYQEWFSGYDVDPMDYMKCFSDGAPHDPDEVVIVSGIVFYSFCEHHMAPFFGVANVGYLPKDRIIGLSKLARVVDAYARRLQVQERLCNQIVDAVNTGLDTRGCGVVMHARHMCMESRGVNKPGTVTTTSALRGAFRTDPTIRAEFLNLLPRVETVRI